MIKCPNCGVDAENGAKFCIECGKAIPQVKECPKCHAQLNQTVKFCSECGYHFFGGVGVGEAAVSIGDKNVIAGDVIGHKVSYQISGDAVIIKNEDETRKMVRCHVCGRNMPKSESFECPECHEISCQNCYDVKLKTCSKCASFRARRNEEEYREVLRRVYEDGIVEYNERQELNALKKRLSLSDGTAEALEREIRPASARNTELSSVEKGLLKDAEEALFNDNRPMEVVKSLKPIYGSHPYDEDILMVYLPALAITERATYDDLISHCKIDSVAMDLSRIDLLMRENGLAADNQINEILLRWPKNSQFRIRRVICDFMAYSCFKEKRYLDIAVARFVEIEPTSGVLENSWYEYAAAMLAPYVKDMDTRRNPAAKVYRAIVDGTFLNFKPIMIEELIDANWARFNIFDNMGEMSFSDDEIEVLSAACENGNLKASFLLGAFLSQHPHYHKNNEAYSGVRVFEMVSKAAEHGHANAQNWLGGFYRDGKGVETDYAAAVKWFKKAAEQGNADAQFNLCVQLYRGEGVEKDDDAAVMWCSKAAEQGHVSAQNWLGKFYVDRGRANAHNWLSEFYGKGVEKDYSAAVKWFKKAAEQGHAQAQFNLCVLLCRGEGVEKDYEAAVMWCSKAAEQGYADAQNWLGEFYRDGEGVEQNYSAAVKWFKKAAKQGHVQAQFNLCVRLYRGEGVEKDYAAAVMWCSKAAEQGYANAQNWLGEFYRDGEGVEKDYAAAVKWFKKAAAQGHAYAQFNLCFCLYRGEGVEKDYDAAVMWCRNAAEQGNARAQNLLGEFYRDGKGVEKDYAVAVKWFKKAADQGNTTARDNINGLAEMQYWLGVMYRDGYGVEQDREEALKWFRKAADRGDARAKKALGR